jgi:hypothetical protein
MHLRICQLLMASAVTFCGADSYAQQQPGSVYVIGGAAFMGQDGHSGSLTTIYEVTPDGRTGAWIVGGGVLSLRRRVSSLKYHEPDP